MGGFPCSGPIYRGKTKLISDAPNALLSAKHIGKKFCRGIKRSSFYGVMDVLGEITGGAKGEWPLRIGEFWALQDVSFILEKGQSLGIVGANGSGKTTLLKILSGLLRPDRGTVHVHGKVSPLIALGAGFNAALSGRENIYTNLSILGFNTREIDARLGKVIEFADIGDAIDAPLKTYSSGMSARLAFACASHADADILAIDEVLAVGDAAFRAKCYRWLSDLMKKGVSVMLVSHSPASILAVCDTALYLKKGCVAGYGPAEEVLERYEEESYSARISQQEMPIHFNKKIDSSFSILGVTLTDSNGQRIEELESGKPAEFHVHCRATEDLSGVSLGFIVRNVQREDGALLTLESEKDGHRWEVAPGEFILKVHWPYCGLNPGTYNMKVFIKSEPYFNVLDIAESILFKVKKTLTVSRSGFYQPRRWEMVS